MKIEAQQEIENMIDEIMSHSPAEPEFCCICSASDNDKEHDHLRHCYKVGQDILSNEMFRPHLWHEEMGKLQRGENPICSNRYLCRKRAIKKTTS